MKKLFGREKPSLKRPSFEEDPSLPTRPYQLSGSHSSSFTSLPTNISPVPSPFLPRAASPFSITPSHGRETQVLRKKPQSTTGAIAAVGILKALDPHLEGEHRSRDLPEELPQHYEPPMKEDKKDRRPFWDRNISKEREREREHDRDKLRDRDRRDEEGQAELSRMIGQFTACFDHLSKLTDNKVF
jgi:hypothetical protein